MTIDRPIGRLVLAAGVAALAADACYLVFAAVGEPWGLMNDLLNGVFGVLAGWVAWSLRGHVGTPAAAMAALGSAIMVVGSWLVVGGVSGWFLGGLVSSVGLALLGPAGFAIDGSLGADGSTSARIAMLGKAAGAISVIGLLAVVGVAQGLDNDATAPGWAWIPFVGWLGGFVLYPAWAIIVGRAATARQPSGVATRSGTV
jgi:hypothetical protein